MCFLIFLRVVFIICILSHQFLLQIQFAKLLLQLSYLQFIFFKFQIFHVIQHSDVALWIVSDHIENQINWKLNEQAEDDSVDQGAIFGEETYFFDWSHCVVGIERRAVSCWIGKRSLFIEEGESVSWNEQDGGVECCGDEEGNGDVHVHCGACAEVVAGA